MITVSHVHTTVFSETSIPLLGDRRRHVNCGFRAFLVCSQNCISTVLEYTWGKLYEYVGEARKGVTVWPAVPFLMFIAFFSIRRHLFSNVFGSTSTYNSHYPVAIIAIFFYFPFEDYCQYHTHSWFGLKPKLGKMYMTEELNKGNSFKCWHIKCCFVIKLKKIYYPWLLLIGIIIMCLLMKECPLNSLFTSVSLYFIILSFRQPLCVAVLAPTMRWCGWKGVCAPHLRGLEVLVSMETTEMPRAWRDVVCWNTETTPHRPN